MAGATAEEAELIAAGEGVGAGIATPRLPRWERAAVLDVLEARPKPARILIADDDDDIRSLLASRVASWGYEVHTARNGTEALHLANGQPFDLVLLDIVMPGPDGLAVMAALRTSPSTRSLPILLLSSRNRDDDVAAGFDAGADDYLKKPFQPLEIRARVEAALARSRSTRALQDLRDAISPQEPATHPALEIAVSSRPIADAAGGGDLYGLVSTPGGGIVAFVGDALGHGLAAAGLAAHTRSLIANHASFDSSPQRILELTNAALTDYHGGADFFFVSVACMALHPTEGTVEWALAGHPPPLLVPHSGGRLPSATPGPPLGLEALPEYPTTGARLVPGDALLLVSDGLLETRRGSEQFGDRALAEVLDAPLGRHPQALIDAILHARDDFATGPPVDDICALALRATSRWGCDPSPAPR